MCIQHHTCDGQQLRLALLFKSTLLAESRLGVATIVVTSSTLSAASGIGTIRWPCREQANADMRMHISPCRLMRKFNSSRAIMRCLSLLSSLVLYSARVLASGVPRDSSDSTQAACLQLLSQLSNASAVFFPGKAIFCPNVVILSFNVPGSAGYIQDAAHFFLQEIEESVCSVEPGSTEDLGELVSIQTFSARRNSSRQK